MKRRTILIVPLAAAALVGCLLRPKSTGVKPPSDAAHGGDGPASPDGRVGADAAPLPDASGSAGTCPGAIDDFSANACGQDGMPVGTGGMASFGHLTLITGEGCMWTSALGSGVLLHISQQPLPVAMSEAVITVGDLSGNSVPVEVESQSTGSGSTGSGATPAIGTVQCTFGSDTTVRPVVNAPVYVEIRFAGGMATVYCGSSSPPTQLVGHSVPFVGKTGTVELQLAGQAGGSVVFDQLNCE